MAAPQRDRQSRRNQGNNLIVAQQAGGGISFALTVKMTSWLELNNRASSIGFTILRHLVTDNNGNDDGNDDGGGGNSDVRRTDRTKAQNSSHSTDTADSSDKAGNRNKGTRTHNPETRSLFLPIRPPQNVAPERKRFPLPPVQ
jgi:hypothetical protein